MATAQKMGIVQRKELLLENAQKCSSGACMPIVEEEQQLYGIALYYN